MEPQIRYVTTADGVNIAYYAIGQGEPLISFELPNTHLQASWQIADLRTAAEAASSAFTFVRFDPRGFGMSDRDVTDFSVDALVRDLEAVADRLSAPKFRLLATNLVAPIAIAYAARHPERVSQLLLWPGFARGSDLLSEQLDTLTALAEKDWETTTEVANRSIMGWSHPLAEQFAGMMRRAVTPPTFVAFMNQLRTWDVSDVLPSVAARTLILNHRSHPLFSEGVYRRLAAAIPDVRLVIEEDAMSMNETFATIGRFLLTGEVATEQEPGPQPGTAVILFTDIVDSTPLTEQLGDAAFRARSRALDDIVRAVLRERGGTLIEGRVLGDGVMALFASAQAAIGAALRCGAASGATGLQLHTGVHAGDVIHDRDNVYGGAVNIASRICSASAPGEILVSDTVRGLARTSTDVAFDDRGEHEMKGVGEPVHLFAVRPRE